MDGGTMKKRDGINKLFQFIIFFYIFYLLNCYTPPIKKIPTYNYEKIFEKYGKTKSLAHFPIVIQPSEEDSFSVTEDGYLVYSSDIDGNLDIFLRDLNTILKLKIIEHPTIQKNPILRKIDSKNYLLAYESYDQDLNGDIYLVSLNPEEIFKLYINKQQQFNYWNVSINISEFIESYFEKNNEINCKGKFAEIFPMLSSDGKQLFYLSNRCTNRFLLWRLPLKNKMPSGKPEVVFEQEIYYPSLKDNYITFNLMEDYKIQSKIGVLYLKNNQIQILTPKVLNQSLPGLFLKPKISPDYSKLFAIYISKDTNGNLLLDEFDHGILVSLDLEGNLISQILITKNVIYQYESSTFLKNNIIYISDTYKEKDIFLTTYEGNIPKKGDPYEQYEYSKSLENSDLYFFSLQKVFEYFANHEDFVNIEGEILYDIHSYLRNQKKDDYQSYYFQLFESRKKENPFLEISYELRKMEKQKNINIKKIQFYEEILNVKNLKQKDHFYFKVGTILWNVNRDLSITFFNKISKDFILNHQVALYQFLYQFYKEKEDKNKWNESFLVTAIHNNTKNLLTITSLIELEFSKKSILELEKLYNIVQFDLLKNFVLYFKAEKFYSAGNLNQSLEILNSIENSIRNQFKEYLRFLKLKTLKLKIEILKKFNLEKELLNARNEFINSYKKDLGIELDKEEILGIIESSNQYVKKYKAAAQNLYENIKQNFLLKENLLLKENIIEISLIDIDNLKEFCAPDSVAGKLIDDYNYLEYEIRYANLCKNLEPYLSKSSRKIPVDLLFESTQLMYLSSYAYANLINILFVNVHLSEIFLDFHQKWSNYYHRLKVDLAVERFKNLLEWQEKTAFLITKKELTNLLVEKDPFEGTIFNDLLYGYREVASQLAQENLEFSLLYGHAYTLIQKSIEREKFYDSLFLKGFSISNDELIKRKRNILLDLKEAENQLLYILSLDPTNEDASLLLAYLYSYIDTRKEKNILNPPGFIDRTFRYLTKRSPKKLTDGIFYRTLYSNIFPKRLYERNIVLLENTLFLRKLLNLPISNEIYLSLALNHYKIMNYKKAIEFFRNVETKLIFDSNSLEKGLFYYYYAKSNYYESMFTEAIKLIDIAYQIFYEFYKEEEKKFNSINSQIHQEKSEYIKSSEDLLNLQSQIASILILRSLCKYYNQEFSSAILDLKEAIQFIQNTKEIKSYNVYNTLALNFLNIKDYKNALHYATLALKEAENLGLNRNDDKFLPQTVGGRFLGLFINFNEDFAIFGNSRIPDEISSLRSYNISLGILQNLYKKQNDYINTLEIIKEKKKVIEKKDLDVFLGKESYVSLLNQEGTIYFYLDNFEESIKHFDLAYQFALKNNFTKDYYSNFKNIFVVLFYEIEKKLNSDHKEIDINLLKKLSKFYKELYEFKLNYFKLRKDEYIKIKTTENPNYKFQKTDLEILNKIVESELKEFYAIDAIMSLYITLFNFENKSSVETIQEKFKKLINIYKEEKIVDVSYFRVYLNYLKTIFLFSNHPLYNTFIKEWETLYQEIIDYELFKEYIELYKIRGDYHFFRQEFKEASFYYKKAFDKLEFSLIFIEDIFSYKDFVHRYIISLIEEKQYKMAIDIKEKYRFFILHKIFFLIPIFPKNELVNKTISELESNIELIKQLKQKEIQKRFEKKSTKLEKEQIQKLTFKIDQLKQELAKYFLNFKDYLYFDIHYFNKVNPEIEFLYLFSHQNKIYCISVYNKEIRSCNFDKNLISYTFKSKELVIIPDENIYKFNLKEVITYFKTQYVVLRNSITNSIPVFIDTKRKLIKVQDKHYWNFDIDPIVEKWLIKNQKILSLPLILSNRENGIGQYFFEPPIYSKVKLIKEKDSPDSYDTIWILYDVYSHFGILTFEDHNDYIWGVLPISKNELTKDLKEYSQEFFEKGLKIYHKNPKLGLKYFLRSYTISQENTTLIYILSCLILSANPEIELIFDQFYKQIKQKATKKDLILYYKEIIYSILKTNNNLNLTKIIELYKKDLPTISTTYLENTIFVLNELKKQQPDFKKIETIIYNNQYETYLTEIIAESLYHHSAYYLSNELLTKAKLYTQTFSKNQISLYFLNKIQKLNLQNIQDEDFLFVISKNFDLIINKIKNQNEILNSRPKITLYQVLKEKYENSSFMLENIDCDRIDCSKLNDFEKKILFRFLLDSIPYDSYLIAKKNLLYLLKDFYNTSCIKGNIYLSMVIKTYVIDQDYSTAFEFYKNFSNYYKCILKLKESEFYIQDIFFSLSILRALNYKISDSLILELAAYKKNFSDFVSYLLQILNVPRDDVIQIFRNINWRIIPDEYQVQVYDIILNRLINEKDYENFQNFAFYRENRYKNIQNKRKELQNFLKPDELWINIIDLNSKFYICDIRSLCTESSLSSQKLKKTLNRFFYESHYFNTISVDLEELSDFYSKLYITEDNTKDKIRYYWLSGIHKYHPILYKTHSFFVLDPTTFEMKKNEFYISQNYRLQLQDFEEIHFDNQFKSHLRILIDLKNISSNQNKVIYITQKELPNSIVLLTIHKKQFEKPFLDQENWNINPKIKSGIVYFKLNSPFLFLNFVNIFFDNQNLPIKEKLNRIYKEMSLKYPANKEYLLLKPFIQSFVE